MDFLKGFKTFTGIGLLAFAAVAQAVGWDWYAAISGQVESVANHVVAIVGTVVSIWGAVMKARREKALKEQMEAGQ